MKKTFGIDCNFEEACASHAAIFRARDKGVMREVEKCMKGALDSIELSALLKAWISHSLERFEPAQKTPLSQIMLGQETKET